MTDIEGVAVVEGAGPPHSLVTLTHVMYGLHAFSAITGLMSAALVVTAFLTGWPSIIAVIMNYVKRSEAAGSYLDSHFRWQLRTFWFALLWVVIGWLMIVTLIGAIIGVPLLLGIGVWVLYRLARGWVNLANRKPMPV
jgi:uncharacterized membrane protein